MNKTVQGKGWAKMVEIAILGHGVVGSGVAELLIKNAANIAKRAGVEIEAKYILDLRDFPGCPYRDKFTKDFDQILKDPDIQVVVEVMGGVRPAYDFVKASLEAGKSAVTSNKEMVAAKGAELLRIAKENDVNFLFEASVGGGIPIIRPLHQCLAANEICDIAGILNGTTNFILTKMIKESMPFGDALKIAQELGYAEADPTADVDGHDSCRKICILASLAFGSHIYPELVPTEGIRGITLEDVKYAENAGFAIKLIGQARRASDGKIFALVSPALVSHESQLSSVDDVFNAILVRGDSTGDVVFYGKGAGKFPTASAVVGDVIDCVKAKKNIGSLFWADSDKDNVADTKAEAVSMYMRLNAGAEKIKSVFGEVTLLQKQADRPNETAFLTAKMTEGEMDGRLAASGLTPLSKIRVLESE
uniref:Homoserine dehydrogenase n=1 Tax=termite gut metagenome TaxID=433724 RepID=S0DDA0_9ZZZZ